VLLRRLTSVVVAAATIALAACSEGGAIEEGVVRPGITAITEAAPAANCTANASGLQVAVDAYTALEGDPPPDEQALLDAGLIRETTEDWDVVDGELVAENPACGSVPDAPIATLDIVTEVEPPTADEMYEAFDQATIDAIGGEACVRELAAIIAAAQTFVAERSADPAAIDDLVEAGYLTSEPELWELIDDELVPTADSGCNPLD
jgi:hypothetical protein